MSDNERKEEVVEDVNIKKESVTRKEDPSMVGATFIKYAAYIIIVLIVLFFLIRYVFPMF